LSKDFIGRGWSYPARITPYGEISLSEGNDEIEEAITIILSTSPGERPMRPDFGCDLSRFVFGVANTETAALIAQEVKASVARWEPRVNMKSVDVFYDTEEPNTLYLDLQYVVKGSNDPRNLVFPFYVIGRE
jgi:phage baseplate assembly protein W